MNIQLIKGPRMAEETIEVEKGISIEELYKKYEDELPHIVLLAKVNNELKELDYRLYKSCRVEFLDMRNQNGNLVYQNSLILLYLKATEDVLGHVEVCIENALNKGLFTEIKGVNSITAKDVKAIETRMRHLAEGDFPLVREELAKEDAVAEFETMGCPEKIRLLSENPRLNDAPVLEHRSTQCLDAGFFGFLLCLSFGFNFGLLCFPFGLLCRPFRLSSGIQFRLILMGI